MAAVACLGWGSLVWDPQRLPIRQQQWLNDGPLIHVEFARQSKDGRITLVLMQTDRPVQSLWAVMSSTDLDSARSELRVREEIPPKNEQRHVGAWSIGQRSPTLIPDLAEWATVHDIEHVIWTNLPPKFNGSDTTPTAEMVVQYLGGLTGETRVLAERYVRLAPRQIDTDFRRHIESTLDWKALDVSQ